MINKKDKLINYCLKKWGYDFYFFENEKYFICTKNKTNFKNLEVLKK